jgi:hypothetical protein
MATRAAKVPPEEEILPATIPGTGGYIEEEEEQTPEDRVAEMLRGIGDDVRAKIIVFRKGKTSQEYVAEFAAGEFEEGGLELLRAYGPGQYTIHVRGVLPSGKIGLRARQVITIAEARAANPLAVMPGRAPSELASAFDAIAAGQRQMQETLVRIIDKPQADPNAAMMQAFTMMKLMREAMGIEAGPRTVEKSSLAETLENLTALRSMAKDIVGDGAGASSDDPMVKLIEVAGPLIGTISDAIKAKQNAAQPQAALPAVSMPAVFQAVPNAAPPNLETPAPPALNQKDGPDMNMQELAQAMLLKALLTRLLQFKANNAPMADAVDFVAEKLPDELLDILDLDGDVWWTMLCSAAPELVLPHKEWLYAVREGYLQLPADDEIGAENGGEKTAPQNGPGTSGAQSPG